MRSRNRKKNRGFTLVELLVVVAVMLVLASVLFFSITAWVNYSSFLNSESGAKSLYLSAQTALTYLDSRGGLRGFRGAENHRKCLRETRAAAHARIQ